MSRRLLSLVSVLVLILGTSASAETPGFRGTWEIGVESADKARRVVGYFALGCRTRVFRVDGTWAGHADAPPDTTVWKGETSAGLTAAWIERFQMTLAGDGETATGTWYNGYETFRASWRRLRPENARIRAVSPTKDGVRLEVIGSKLFYYERGRFAQCAEIFVEGTGMTVASKTIDPQAEAVMVDVAVKPDTPGGPQILSFEGARLPWEWAGRAAVAPLPAPGVRPKVVALQFGRLEAGRFVAYAPTTPMPYDRPFAVQVRYASPPAYDQTTVTLTTKAGGRHAVPVYKLATSPEVFQSRAIVFEDPSGCRGLRICDAK